MAGLLDAPLLIVTSWEWILWFWIGFVVVMIVNVACGTPQTAVEKKQPQLQSEDHHKLLQTIDQQKLELERQKHELAQQKLEIQHLRETLLFGSHRRQRN
jgi:hypothetical protein